MKNPQTFKEAVETFERYYNFWTNSNDYQLGELFKQGWGGRLRDDGRLATGAIVAVMAVLKDSSISRDLHNLDRKLGQSSQTVPLPFDSAKLEQIRRVIGQKMRTLLQGSNRRTVVSQLFDFYSSPSEGLPVWVQEFYVSCSDLVDELCVVIYSGK